MNIDKGIVYRSTGSWYVVKLENGDFIESRIKGKFRIKNLKTTNPIAVGDKVGIHIQADGKGLIEEIFPRTNYMIRKSVNLSKEAHIIGSNIHVCILVATLNNPYTSTGFIDRFSVTSQAYDIPLIIVFNKVDLYDDKDKKVLSHYISIYENAGFQCLMTSAVNGEGVGGLKKILSNKVVLFSGHSGSGKSSLINAMDPKFELKVGELSEAHSKGKHTTTFAEMFDLDENIQLIDTPGIKGFGLVDFKKEELAKFFPEMFSISDQCRFNNCVHLNEPGCAVIEAVKNEQIAKFRYESYQSMYNDDQEETFRTVNY